MRKRTLIANSLASTLGLWLGAAPAQEPPVLRAVGGNDTAPFNFTDAKGDFRGLGLDVAAELARRSGMRLEARPLPWGRALQMAREQPNLLLFTAARTPEREAWFHWIGPMAEREVWLWKLATRHDIQLASLADVRRYRVADTPNNATVPALQQLGVDIQYATSHTAIAELLKADRADLAPVNVFNIEAFAASAGMETAQLARAILLTRSGGYYLVLHRDSDPALVARLQAAFAAMVKDKTLARIVASWSPKGATGAEPARK